MYHWILESLSWQACGDYDELINIFASHHSLQMMDGIAFTVLLCFWGFFCLFFFFLGGIRVFFNCCFLWQSFFLILNIVTVNFVVCILSLYWLLKLNHACLFWPWASLLLILFFKNPLHFMYEITMFIFCFSWKVIS